MDAPDLKAPQHYINRELSFLEFNQRVLDQAFDELAVRLPRASGLAERAAQPDPVASALAVLQQRLVDERTSLAAELSRLQAELDHLRASPEHRLAKPLHDAYRRWQRRRT